MRVIGALFTGSSPVSRFFYCNPEILEKSSKIKGSGAFFLL